MIRTLFITIIICFVSISSWAQIPQAFKYQAVARDAAGNLFAYAVFVSLKIFNYSLPIT